MEGAAMPVGPIHHRRNAKSMALVQFKAPGDIKMGKKLHAFSVALSGFYPHPMLPERVRRGHRFWFAFRELAGAGTAPRRERMRLKLP
jgi:hypothetical protein